MFREQCDNLNYVANRALNSSHILCEALEEAADYAECINLLLKALSYYFTLYVYARTQVPATFMLGVGDLYCCVFKTLEEEDKWNLEQYIIKYMSIDETVTRVSREEYLELYEAVNNVLESGIFNYADFVNKETE